MKDCNNCKHFEKSQFDKPCRTCVNWSNWEAVDQEDDEPIRPEPDSVQDVVNHPSHYCQEGSMECIDEMIAVFGEKAVMTFCLLNVWKYRKRAIFKNGEEDLKKSDWYMNKYIELKGDSYDWQ
jgi:hypothetical protein